MNDEIRRRLNERYANSESRNLDKFLNENPDLKIVLGELVENVPWFENVRNAFIAIGHGIEDVVNCRTCGQPLKVENAIYGRHFYCCKKCADNSLYANEKRKQTCLKKYGTTTPLLNDECKKKTVATCMEKFGNVMFAGSDEYKKRVPSAFNRKEVQEKSRQTKIERHGEDFGKVIFEEKVKDSMIERNMEKYGVPYVLMNKEKVDKTHQTMKIKYGEEYYWRTATSNDIKMDIGFSRIETWCDYVVPLFTREEYAGREKEYSWKCVKCGHEFTQRIYTTGLGNDRMVPRCEKCFPNHCSSIAEREIAEFVKSIYDGEMVLREQTVLNGRKELDIYLPEKKVAIEFDGLYWHSEENGKDSGYHLNKTVECEKNGIHLIHIFEDEWNAKQEIVKDRIRSILGIGQTRIFARKCSIMQLDSKTSNEFLEANHLQGKDFSMFRYGLFFRNELVAVMTFGKPRFDNDYDYELIRFASKNGYCIAGGASRLLRHFRDNYDGSIVTYADRRYSDGTFYKKIGFALKGVSQPNYWYVKNNEKLSRYACQKHKLPELLGDGFDASLSERENMIANGYHVVYDCGNLIFELK